MKSVVRFSLKQAVFINVVFVILVVAGLFSLHTSPIENMPVVSIGKVFIQTFYFGAPAEDVEQLVTRKIEDSLDGIEEVEFVQSHSYRNYSTVQVKFIDDSDYKDLYDELRFRTLNAKKEFPEGVDDPVFFYLDTNAWKPVIVINLTGDIPKQSLELLAEELKNQVLAVPGVQNVELRGEYEKEFHVSLDPEKLRKLGITFNQASQAILSANTKIPTGRFRTGDTEYMLDAGERLNNQKDVLDVVVRRDGDHFVRIRDLVTNARLSHRDPFVIPSVNGENSLRLWVVKEPDGNSLDISKSVKRIADDFGRLHEKDGVEIVFTRDSTIEINDSVKTLGWNLFIGMVLVCMVLWLTLGFRNAMLTAVGIPFSFLVTFVIMRITGVSLNTISLFSFVLVTGIMVDDAVIIVENIFRHFQMGKTRKEAIVDGTAEVMMPVFASALTTVLAFLPMLIMSGSTGEFFSYIPMTVTYALCASLFEALLILPVHILDWGPKKLPKDMVTEDEDPYHHLKSGLFAPMWKVYRAILDAALSHKLLSIFGVAVLFFISVGIFILSATGKAPLIKIEFFPGNYFRYHVTVAMPIGTSLEKTDRMVRDLSRFITGLGENQAQSASGSAGFLEDQDYVRHYGHYNGEIIVTLPEDDVRDFPDNPKNDPMLHLEYMRTAISGYLDSTLAKGEPRPEIRVFPEGEGPPSGKDVNIRVTAPTLETAIAATEAITGFMESNPELEALRDIDDDRPRFQQAVQYRPRQEAAYEYGLMPGQVTSMVAGLLYGFPAGDYRALDEEVDLLVRVARKDDQGNTSGRGLEHPVDILNVPLVEHAAAPVMLGDLVDVEFTREPNVRHRYKGRPTITISADIAQNEQLSSVRVSRLVDDFFKENQGRFPGVSVTHGGQFEATSRSYESLYFAFLIALLGIYMVLSSQFNDYFQPVIIISAVPFALIGVVMGLFLTRTTFTIGSFMAIVGLAGVAVNNSLLLIDFMNHRREKGKTIREAVMESCAARMRPVLITTVTTTLGLLPMAIGIPNKSIAWSPMATSFVAGLASATLLAIIMIPVEYELFENIRSALKTRYGRSHAQTPEV